MLKITDLNCVMAVTISFNKSVFGAMAVQFDKPDISVAQK